ncbi:hypothetical protein [Shinella zoogloeoides]|uniref:DUF7940 domain-containing protein n=1 Tax=Shinella zoogloeoides TaxID=352475 RepID=UPI001F5887DE|nr:hypothetical protein [Shinella zoogloeoides]
MRPVANWRAVLRYAWSIRLIALAGILSGIEVALPLAGDVLPIPTGLFAGLSLLVTAAAFVARIVAQKGISDE